ncbi:MAG: sulfotransferase [Rhodospirillales bacterium]|nr:sulfotransferase [Rhodospirillales bacterium]
MTAAETIAADGAEAARSWHAAAIAAHRLGRRSEALDCMSRALALSNDAPDLLNDAAAVLFAAGRPQEAIERLRQAAALAPGNVAFQINLAIAQRRTGKIDAALGHCAAAIAIAPHDPEAHLQSARCLRQAERLDEAVAAFRTALALKPDWLEAEVELAATLQDLGRVDEAVAFYRDLAARRPEESVLWNNLGKTLLNLPAPEEAIAAFDRAAALAPEQAEIRYNRALGLLAIGRDRQGWEDHQARWRLATPPQTVHKTAATVAAWDGAAIPGRTLLLHAEQGLGDTLQFIRFVAIARRRGLTTSSRVIVEVQPPLLRLVRGAAAMLGIDDVVVSGEAYPAEPEFQRGLLDLPAILGITLDDIDGSAYLPAPEATLPRDGTRRIGVVWAGNPKHGNDRRRSLPLAAARALVDGIRAEFAARGEAIEIFSLQVGPRAGELADTIDQRFATPGDFTDTAAALASLDVAIAVDTSTAHLAGALGIPVWLLVAFIPDWRWRYTGDRTSWYQSMRLFRQERRGDWESVVEAVRERCSRTRY